jgi:hypothetical protein
MLHGRGWIAALALLSFADFGAVGLAQDASQAGRSAIIKGTVLDAATGRPIVGASVVILEADEAIGRTDLDGKFSAVVAPGTYRVRISAPLYETILLENVVARPGDTTFASASLKARVDTRLEVVEVVADVTAATEATQLLKRRMAPTVSDNLGAESISKTPDSDAAEVVTRVPAVTIKDDKFVVVRGLAERYSSALLNGSRLPSTDPNRRVVPLDLFPANFIESLTIVKSYMPNLPGDFAGGLVDIQLAEPPDTLTYSLGFSTGFNTVTTFQSFDTYEGTTLDWFGFGDDYRSLPGLFGDKASEITRGPTTTQMRDLVGSLRNNWDIDSKTAPPNFSVNGSVGSSFGPFGFNLASVYGTKHQGRRNEAVNGFLDRGNFERGLGLNLVYDRSTFETQLGAVLTTVYELSPSHKLFARGLYNRKSTDEVLTGSGTDSVEEVGRPIFATELDYKADQLGFGQIEGRHHWPRFDVDWRASWAPSLEDQPDNKFTVYQLQQGNARPELIFKQPSTSRNFANLEEFLQDYYVDLSVPFRTRLPFTDVWSGLGAELKSGLAYSLRDRSFAYRRFVSEPSAGISQVDLSLPPQSILVPENYGTFAGAPMQFREATRRSDSFDASQEIAAAYTMIELPIVPERLRFVGGARVEYSYLVAEGVGILPPVEFRNIINDVDPMPGVSLIYSPRDDMNVRVAYGQSVSRPEFRELTPTQFPTAPGERVFQGNPNLTTAHIKSYDLRWEWFFSPLEVASASFFYKDLKDPIEIVQIPETSNLLDTTINADSAYVWGFEFEGRKDFNFLVPRLRRWRFLKGVAPALADLQIIANASIVESEVTGLRSDATLGDRLVPTNETRQLVGQAPFVINAALEYEHYRWGVWRLLYNTVGETVTAGGVDIQPENPLVVGLPDIFQQRRDQLDLVWILDLAPFGAPLKTKFAVENILNDDYVEKQGSQITNRYFTGVTFTMGATYTF